MTERRRTILRSKRRNTAKIMWKVLAGSTVTLVLVGLFFTVFKVTRIDALTISHINVDGLETLAEAEVTKKVDESLNGTYWGIIPKRFLYLYPSESILTTLKAIDRVSDASLRTEQNALIISVTEHTPYALWCKAGDEVSTDCFFTNDKGVAYEVAPSLIGGTMPRFYIEGREPKKDETMLSAELLTQLTSLSKSLEQTFNLRVQDFTVHQVNDVTLRLSTGAEIKIDTTDSIEQVFSNISSILSAKQFENLKTGKFEYIDLRFGNKVFVEKEPPLDTASSTGQATTTR